jgi:hypothetical protein
VAQGKRDARHFNHLGFASDSFDWPQNCVRLCIMKHTLPLWLGSLGGAAALLAGCSGTVLPGDPVNPSPGPTYGNVIPNTGNGAGQCAWPTRGDAPRCTGGAPGTRCGGDAPVSSGYKVGDKFPAPDGCNTCQCSASGIACTELACVPPTGGVCVANGVTYKQGQRWGGGGTVNPTGPTPDVPPSVPVMPPPPPQDPPVKMICGSGSSGSTSGSTGSTSGWSSSGSSGYECECKAGGVVECVQWATASGGGGPVAGGSGGGAPSGKPAPPSSSGGGDAIVAPSGDCVCLVGKSEYPVFSSFPAADGCNTCSCQPEGVICTANACPPPPPPPALCNYNGSFYRSGEAFPAGDGCNKCSCSTAKGIPEVTCTALACPKP